VEKMLSTFIAGLIGNAGQHVRIKLGQTLDVALWIVDSIQSGDRKKEMKLFMQTWKSTVLMLAQVENLVTLISSHELACNRKVKIY
jgi:hypothetical protein